MLGGEALEAGAVQLSREHFQTEGLKWLKGEALKASLNHLFTGLLLLFTVSMTLYTGSPGCPLCAGAVTMSQLSSARGRAGLWLSVVRTAAILLHNSAVCQPGVEGAGGGGEHHVNIKLRKWAGAARHGDPNVPTAEV